MRPFRFSYNVFAVPSREVFVRRCRQAEAAGYDTVFVPDHLGAPAPFPVLVAAAEATERLRVGTLPPRPTTGCGSPARCAAGARSSGTA